jgi:hypothetical protein
VRSAGVSSAAGGCAGTGTGRLIRLMPVSDLRPRSNSLISSSNTILFSCLRAAAGGKRHVLRCVTDLIIQRKLRLTVILTIVA